jgi:hypothetical protein
VAIKWGDRKIGGWMGKEVGGLLGIVALVCVFGCISVVVVKGACVLHCSGLRWCTVGTED